MKNVALNTLKYTGIVTLSQYVGNKKVEIAQVYNAGTNILFEFFSDCLLGYFDFAQKNRPTKIMLLQYDIDKKAYINKSGYITYTNVEKVYNESEGIVRYSFTVTRDILEGNTFDSIGLYAKSTKINDYENYAAIVKLTEDEITNQSLVASTALIVDWELHISNKA